MKMYFRRASINPGMRSALPDSYIVESVLESGFTDEHRKLSGWEELEEVDFQVEFAKNQERYDAFILEREAIIQAEAEAQNKEE